MTADEIKSAVMTAVELRPPKFEQGTAPRTKIEALEDYLLGAAHAQAELEEALFYIDGVITQMAKTVEDMTGWEALLPPKPRDRITKEDIARAKRLTEPVVFELGAEMKQLRGAALRQIDKLRFESQWVISRAYSMVSGS